MAILTPPPRIGATIGPATPLRPARKSAKAKPRKSLKQKPGVQMSIAPGLINR